MLSLEGARPPFELLGFCFAVDAVARDGACDQAVFADVATASTADTVFTLIHRAQGSLDFVDQRALAITDTK